MEKTLQVAIVEPFYTGSHKTWVDDLTHLLPHSVVTYTLPGRFWKWRMSAGAIELAHKVNKRNESIDVFLVTDMLDVATFKGLLAVKYQQVPIVLYMHENQVVYPFQTDEKQKNWDRHYGLINYKSILCANYIWFNSKFHKDIFTAEMKEFLAVMPDPKFHQKQVEQSIHKMKVVPLGVDFLALENEKLPTNSRPTVLWNHRWEYDKNPELFFKTLIRLSEEGLDFDLIVCGEAYTNSPQIFEVAKRKLTKHIIHWGYFKKRLNYYKALWTASILPVTSNQEFFGLSVMEAMYCGVMPILPKRLSYPDLYHGLNVFYETDEEFHQVVRAAIQTNSRTDYQKDVLGYDWKNVVELYSTNLLTAAT